MKNENQNQNQAAGMAVNENTERLQLQQQQQQQQQQQRESTAEGIFAAGMPEASAKSAGRGGEKVTANNVEIEGEKYSLAIAEKSMIQTAEIIRDSYFVRCISGDVDDVDDARMAVRTAYLGEYRNILTKLGPKNARLFSRVFRGLFRDGIFPTLDSVRARRAEIVETMKAERTAREIQAKAEKIAKLAESLGTTPEAIQAALKLGMINLK